VALDLRKGGGKSLPLGGRQGDRSPGKNLVSKYLCRHVSLHGTHKARLYPPGAGDSEAEPQSKGK